MKINSLSKGNWAIVGSLLILTLIFCIAGAKFSALQAVRLAAKQAIQLEIDTLSISKPKSINELQGIAASTNEIATIDKDRLERLYLITDLKRNSIAGNLSSWPEGTGPYNGWHTIDLEAANLGSGKAYGRVFSLKAENNKPFYKMMVARRMADPHTIFQIIFPIFLSVALLALAAGCFLYKETRDGQDLEAEASA